MKLLILGGTIFLGRHLVDAALARGHQVTLFNRGQHNPDLFPTVEKLAGDRGGDLTVLRNRRWDAVLDTCGYLPRLVQASAALLADQVDRYIFVSTISVYAEPGRPGLTEGDAVATLADAQTEEITGESYGPLKALCEQAAEQALPGRVLVIRPGLIVGPHDPSDRFTYWPVRLARGGDVLAPGDPSQPVQLIDGRDLAAWILRMVEGRAAGIYNATGPAAPLTMDALLAACRQTADTRLVWTSDEFLTHEQVGQYVELPLWLTADSIGLDQVDISQALAAGLRFRPLTETVADTLAWHMSRSPEHRWRAGLSPEREAGLLAAWRSQPPSGRRPEAS